MKLNRVIFTLIFSISTSLFSQAKIEPMLCEGELPADLKKSLSDISKASYNALAEDK